jgi:predicted RNase H-like HicB family nuclease
MTWDLYLESGPQHRRTWIFVPSLPGCMAVAATSEEAPAVAADAIATRLEFLRDHGEAVDPGPIDVHVADHVIERKVLGFEQQMFPPDFVPLTPGDAERLMRWLEWSREALVTAAKAAPAPLTAKPNPGRSPAGILSHVAGAELAYVAATVGFKGAGPLVSAVEDAGDEPWGALAAERAAAAERLERLTAEEMSRVVNSAGRPKWTARRMFRRMLEHEWEHTLELRARAR